MTQIKVVDLLIQKSAEKNLDLNGRSKNSNAFHFVCGVKPLGYLFWQTKSKASGLLKIAMLLIENSSKFDIDLNRRYENGFTTFHVFC